jgi:hypothetical protein
VKGQETKVITVHVLAAEPEGLTPKSIILHDPEQFTFISDQHLLKIHVNDFASLPRLLCGRFPRGFPTKILYVSLVSPILATLSVLRNLQDVSILIILGDLYKSRCFSLHIIINWSCTSSFLDPNIFLSTFLKTCNSFPSLKLRESLQKRRIVAQIEDKVWSYSSEFRWGAMCNHLPYNEK